MMASIVMDHGVSWCFGSGLGTNHPVHFTMLYCCEQLAHGTIWSLSIWQTDLSRYQGTRVQAAPELPEAKYFGFEHCRRGVSGPDVVSLQCYQLLSKMPPL